MMTTLTRASERTLIDELLADQQQLTAVERFARQHERDELPAQARYYRELIPLARPQPGEQYAFAVDLDKCTACKACVSACHSLNGLDEEEIWRNVGSLHGGTQRDPYQQTVTTACHHCVDPGCLLGCPVMAYEKDAETGIVRHLDDQCIGCEYCILKCPYDVPKYSKKRGIVRKCDMCYQRLQANEAPACVQACPNEAITIRIASKSQARAEALPGVRLLPGAFDSSYTAPTTAYTTRKVVPANAHPADVYRLRLEHPHWPLIAMLLLSQLSAGLYICLAACEVLPGSWARTLKAPLALAGFGALQAGLLLSVLHLGQPMKAWRFFLGLRTSWMSREILAFGLFAGASAAVTATTLGGLPQAGSLLAFVSAHGGPARSWIARIPLAEIAGWTPPLAITTAFLALAGIFCSAMIYVDTRRPIWSGALTFPKFFGTTLALGAAAGAVIASALAALGNLPGSASLGACLLSLLVGIVHTLYDFGAFHAQLENDEAPAHRAALTAKRLLRHVLDLRGVFILIFTGAAALACFAGGVAQTIGALLALLALLGSAIAERYCFFRACDAPRMPGGISA